MAKLMVEKHARKNICKTYSPGEKVFIRIGKKRENFAKRHKVLTGTMEKKYQDNSYLVKYKLLNSDDSSKAKFRIEDIFDFPKDKNINPKENEKNKERKAYQKSLGIPKTRNDLIDEITVQDQFLALCDSLLNFGILDPHKH